MTSLMKVGRVKEPGNLNARGPSMEGDRLRACVRVCAHGCSKAQLWVEICMCVHQSLPQLCSTLVLGIGSLLEPGASHYTLSFVCLYLGLLATSALPSSLGI